MVWGWLSDTKPRAKKTSKCFLCGEAIEPGEIHIRRSGINDGRLDMFRMHLECEAETHDWNLMDWESTSEGDMNRPQKVEV